MNHNPTLKPIAVATLVCGTLDILWAVILTLWFGRDPANMLRFVASGPFPGATDMGGAGAILGLLVHFALMAIMAAAYMILAPRIRLLLDRPWIGGLLFGLVTYVIMNLLVVPLRFGTPLPPSATSIATQLFAHVVLVGWPMAWIAARNLRSRS